MHSNMIELHSGFPAIMASISKYLNRIRLFLKNLSKLRSVISRSLNEIEKASDLAKNGRWYLHGDGSIFSKIYTEQVISLDPYDISLAPHLVLAGIWEMELSRFSEKIIGSKKDDCIIFDVGANFGWYGLILSRFSVESSIHFFEANPALIHYLKKTVVVNGICERSSIVNKAVSVLSDQELILEVPKFHKGSSKIGGLPHLVEEEKDKDPIITISLDDYCDSNGIEEIHFLKIDVEGFEGNVLSGAKRIIDSSPNLSLLIEWNFGNYDHELWGVLRRFASCQCLDRTSGKIIDITRILVNSSSVPSFEKSLLELNYSSGSAIDLFLHRQIC